MMTVHRQAKAKADPNAAAGLLAIYYRVLRERSDLGFAAWNVRVREVEAQLCGPTHLLPRLATLDRAADALVRSPLRWQAGAALLTGAWLMRHRKGLAAPFEQAVERLELGEVARARERIRGADDPDQAFAIAYAELTSCKFRYQILRAELDALGVTRVDIRVSRGARPSDDIQALAQMADPQCWDEAQPDTFEDARRTTVASPLDPLSTPKDEQVPIGEGWSGYLFEHAAFKLIPDVPFSAFRNILNVAFVVQHGALSIDYSLYEALSNQTLGGPPQLGGLDVDSGNGSVTLDASELVVRAAKNIRVTNAAFMHYELNLFSLPYLVTWLSAWLLKSVCP